MSSLVSSGIEALGQTGNLCTQDLPDGTTIDVPEVSKFGASGYYKAVMIASGGLSGGLSSCIAGGIPIAIGRKGVQQGLLTSGLNHAAVSSFLETAITDPTKIKKSSLNDVKEGDVLNYHNNGGALDLFAQQSKPKKGIVEIHDHGTPEGTLTFSMNQILKLGEELYLKSPTWRNMIDNGVEIELHLFACSTGANTDSGGSGFAQTLSRFYPKVTVKAPTDYWTVRAYENIYTGKIVRLSHGFIKNPGIWNYFKNGIKLIN